MKPILITLMLIFIPSALALNGGDTWIKHFVECNKLRVNITGELIIDDGEYTIHNDCNETYENYFICNCSNDFDFNVSFEVNAVNNYTFKFNYDYSKEVIEETITTSSGGGSSGGGGGGGSRIHWNCEEWNECINGNSTRYCYNNYNTKRKEIVNCTIEKETELPIIEESKEIEIKPNETIVGGGKDEHGCVATAGYTWCEPMQECLRNWEEECIQPEQESDGKKGVLTVIIIIAVIAIITLLIIRNRFRSWA